MNLGEHNSDHNVPEKAEALPRSPSKLVAGACPPSLQPLPLPLSFTSHCGLPAVRGSPSAPGEGPTCFSAGRAGLKTEGARADSAPSSGLRHAVQSLSRLNVLDCQMGVNAEFPGGDVCDIRRLGEKGTPRGA